jgi:hypothetical protein
VIVASVAHAMPHIAPSGVRQRAWNLALAAATASALVAPPPAGAATTVPAFLARGRVAVSEPHSCDGGNDATLRTNALMSWSECHALKRHMLPDGQPVTQNRFVARALRPLRVTVRLHSFCTYADGTRDAAPRATIETESAADGQFSVTVPASTCGRVEAAVGVAVGGSIALRREVRDAGGVRFGTIRAVWMKQAGLAVYDTPAARAEPVVFSLPDFDGDLQPYVVPRLDLETRQLALPLPAEVSLGEQTFFRQATAADFPYVRGALGAWQTLSDLHDRLAAELAAEGFGSLYEDMFESAHGYDCERCFHLVFSTGGGGFGGAGSFSIGAPIVSPSAFYYASLVAIGLVAHELGHAIHFSLAPGSAHGYLGYDDSIAVGQNRQGVIVGFHIAYQWGSVLQQQELGVALVEGFGNAMAAHFLTGCRIDDRGWGDPSPLRHMWNSRAYRSCDELDGCPYQAFRLQLRWRGIAENSATWNRRLANLTRLARRGAVPNGIVVLGNNELKVRNFFCDLLDDQPDVAFAVGKTAGKSYVPDLTWHALERVDGRNPPVALRTYAADPEPENVQLPLGRLLEALDRFAPGLTQVPGPLWLQPTLVDGAQKAYNDGRVSTAGVLSAQSLGRFLVEHGDLTLPELQSILRANRMDEIP